MFMPVKFEWHLSQAYPFPILEFAAEFQKTFEIPQVVYINIAMDMINNIERYGGTIVSPVNDIPSNQEIFFTALFKSNKELEKFTQEMGFEWRGN